MPRLLALVGLLSVCLNLIAAGNVDVVPPPLGDTGSLSLGGSWKFRYHAGSDAGADEKFWQPGFDVTGWGQIAVPGHWELQGWAAPHYADNLQEGLGLYRRSFTVPKAWRADGRKVFLRFEGVLYGYAVWVNGKQVGEWASGFNPATFDVTDALPAEGGPCEVAVRVTTHGRGWDFDTMDCWSISGIYREATLFSLPSTHLKEWSVRTTLGADGAARVAIDLLANGPTQAKGRLIGPDGKPVGDFDATLTADGRGHADLTVASPALWTAETPLLHTLEVDLGAGAQKLSTRIGLREVTTAGGVLRLNGKPIKLRGVDHHDIWPETGRTATEANLRRDLRLMREANINFIRTSHYPPHPRFLELCDEMGFYVDDEVPYIHGRGNLKNKTFLPDLLARARATVLRDRTHACVLFWTTGNENSVTTNGIRVGELVTELDPSRTYAFPTIGRNFDEFLPKFPASMGIYAAHYPSVKQAAALAKSVDRPLVFTEYAHQRGITRAGSNVQDLWEIFQREERIAGGAIWHFQDQGLLRVAKDPKAVTDEDIMVWLDEHRYYDTFGFSGMDGILYSDRTPQLDYWMVRKVYSPVQITERRLKAEPGAATVSIELENRRDFRSLSGMKLRWELMRNGNAVRQGELTLSTPARGRETLRLPVALEGWPVTDVLSLGLRFVDQDGSQPYERSLALDVGTPPEARLRRIVAASPAAAPKLTPGVTDLTVRSEHWSFVVDRGTGRARLLAADGAVLADGFGPNAGHSPTTNDMANHHERLPRIWGHGLLREAKDVVVSTATEPDGAVTIEVKGDYPRPGHPGQSLRGGYALRFRRDGTIKVSYDYLPVSPDGEATQLGFSISAPPARSEFRWLGQGPYAGYAGKDRQNEYGAFHLGAGDLYLPGNRREVELAALGSPAGAGLLFAGTNLTLDVEETPAGTQLTHLAVVPGEHGDDEGKGENVNVSSRLRMSGRKRFLGSFILLPLGDTWPQALTDALGRPGDAAKPFKPFLRSYDR